MECSAHETAAELQLQQYWNQKLEELYEQAKRELRSLLGLLKQVIQYSVLRDTAQGHDPWRDASMAQRFRLEVQLHGVRLKTLTRNGRERQVGLFPIYYAGDAAEAPPLPAEILLSEVVAQREIVEELEELRNGASDWAPGGRKYLKLVNETEGSAARYNRRRGALIHFI